jgi:hypothetical protein
MYQVSNEGNVKSLNYNHTGNERILRPADNGHGYLNVFLCKDGKTKTYYLHRLVASAFIENPDNLPQVNHKDENPSNNNVENLEWCTCKQNINYGTRNARIAESKKGKPNPRAAEALSIPIDMLTKDGELIRTFPSAHEAMRWLRVNGFPKAGGGHINQCCKGNPNYAHAYGFKWRYAQGN